MFTSMTARVSTNTYCLARTRRFSRRSENSVGRVTHKCEAPTDTVQLVVMDCVYLTTEKRLQKLNATYSQLFTHPILHYDQ